MKIVVVMMSKIDQAVVVVVVVMMMILMPRYYYCLSLNLKILLLVHEIQKSRVNEFWRN